MLRTEIICVANYLPGYSLESRCICLVTCNSHNSILVHKIRFTRIETELLSAIAK